MERPAMIRFTVRRSKRGPVEVAHVYRPGGGKIFQARIERSTLTAFLDRLGVEYSRSKTGKTIYLTGRDPEDTLRKLVVFAGCRQCVRSQAKVLDLAQAVAGMGELETIFWFSKMLEAYEARGFWGACRVARAVRALHGI